MRCRPRPFAQRNALALPAMLPWDLLLFGLLFFLTTSCEYGKGEVSSALLKPVFGVGSKIFLGLLSVVVFKLIYDATHWIPGIGKALAHVRSVWHSSTTTKD